MDRLNKKILFLFFCLCSTAAFASGPNFNDTSTRALTSSSNPDFSVNVGIGTATPMGGLVVMNGNVGIGTWVPGLLLDVNGTIRSTAFTMSGASPVGGYVLTATDSSGDTTWSSVGAVGGWTVINGTDVYETSGGNVGIGTTITNAGAALSVMNGNVGIGTWVPHANLSIRNGGNQDYMHVFNSGVTGTAVFKIDSGGNVGIGTSLTTTAGLSIMNGNVGIGTWVPSQAFQVGNASGDYLEIASNGALQTNGVGINIDYGVLYVSDGGGTAQIADASGQANSGLQVLGGGSTGDYLLLQSTSATSTGDYIEFLTGNNGTNKSLFDTNGNLGIGTTTPAGALTVMNGNVGIGTWVPAQKLDVIGTVRMTGFLLNETPLGNGNVLVSNSVGIGTWMPVSTLGAGGSSGLWTTTNTNDVYEANASTWGNVGIGTSITNAGAALSVMNGNVGIGTWVPGATLDVEGTLSTVTFRGNVGIGTTSLSNALRVQPSSNSTTAMVFANSSGSPVATIDTTNTRLLIGSTASSGTNGGLMLGDAGFDTLYMGVGSTGLTIVQGGSGVDGDISFQDSTSNNVTSGTARMTIKNTSGNVGIGTTEPTGILEIEGGNVGIGTYTAPGGGSNNLVVQGNVGIGTTFVGGANEAAFSVINGNVGIGTWVPYIGFDAVNVKSIFGTTYTTSNYPSVETSSSYTNSPPVAILNNGPGVGSVSPALVIGMAEGTTPSYDEFALVMAGKGANGWSSTGTPTALVNGNYLPQMGFAGQTNTSSGSGMVVGTSIAPMIDNTVSSTVLPTAFTIKTSTTSSAGLTERFRISSVGNVGIGSWASNTANLNNTLAVIGNVGIGTSASSSFINTAASSGSLIVQGNVGIGTWVPFLPLNVTGDTYHNGNVGIGTSITTAGAALSVMNGNVGIGTWVPSAALQVNGQYNTIRYNNGSTGGTVTINWNTGNVQAITLTSSITTLNLNNPVAGGRYILEIKQGGSGSYTISPWPSTVKWSGGTAPTLTTTAGQSDIITLYYNGNNYAASYSLNYSI